MCEICKRRGWSLSTIDPNTREPTDSFPVAAGLTAGEAVAVALQLGAIAMAAGFASAYRVSGGDTAVDVGYLSDGWLLAEAGSDDCVMFPHDVAPHDSGMLN